MAEVAVLAMSSVFHRHLVQEEEAAEEAEMEILPHRQVEVVNEPVVR